jgi:predicted DNA-binding protein
MEVKEMMAVRMPVDLLERVDAMTTPYKKFVWETQRREVTRSQMIRDIIEYGVEVLEKRFKESSPPTPPTSG